MHGTKEKGERFGQTASEQASKTVENAKETAAGVLGGAADMANKAAGQVCDTAKEWIGSAEDVAANAAESVKHAANSAFEKAGDMGGEVTRLIRRNPIPAAFVALGIGYLAGMMCHRDSSS
jgi:ElaB/YqjD/DUF883 family membrane-anchored ribosome-binding protein